MGSISVLCATDANYAPWCGIMLASVFESNKQHKVEAYVMTGKPLSASLHKRFDALADKYGNTIRFMRIDESFLEKFPIKGMDYWSIATYYRLYAAELLPKDVHRVLYLDCDIIVQGDLLPLWELDMKDKAVAGVADLYDYCGDFQRHLHYPEEAGYFNAGVLLINLDYWREHAVGQQCLDFLANHYDLVESNDQDVLNAVLWERKMPLPLTYNYQIQFKKSCFYHKYDEKMRREIDATEAPVVIHYASPIKPWNIKYYKMPFKRNWRRFKRKSPWRYKLPQLPSHKAAGYLVKRFLLWPFGIMWQNEYET